MAEPPQEVTERKWLKLIHEFENLHATEGASIYRELTRLRTAIFIYKENYRTLKKALRKYHSDQHNIAENTIKRWRPQRILVKDFHNVIMSARTYVEQNNKNHLNDPFHCFMKELRNFIVHREGLRLISRAITEEGKMIRYETIDWKTFKVYLDERIHEFRKKQKIEAPKHAKDFLSKLPDKISFNKLLEEYDRIITAFHTDYFLDKVAANRTSLRKFVKEVAIIHQKAKELKMPPDHPITEAQLRHLRFVIRKNDKSGTEPTQK